jgi:uncharacterized LabA/DUF88 family protein
MRSCIFVDGENFRHSLVDLLQPEFDREDYLPKTARWKDFFDFLALECYRSERLRTYWYVVQHIDFRPWKLSLKEADRLQLIQTLSEFQPFETQINNAANPRQEAHRIASSLLDGRKILKSRFEGWETLQNGIALAHEAVEFRRSGMIPYDLFRKEFGVEKAVDVKLAVDLLHLASNYDVAIIVSGDGDYVPVVQAIKDLGKRVVNVSFLTRNGRMLPGGARRLNIITDRALMVEYAELKEFMLPTQQDLQLINPPPNHSSQ